MEVTGNTSLDHEPTEAVFYPGTGLDGTRRSGMAAGLSYLTRTGGRDSLSILPAVREVVPRTDPRIPVIAPTTMEEVVKRSSARMSFTLVLVGFAGVLGSVLSVAANRGLELKLYQVRALDPAVLVGVAVSVLGTITLAS